MVRVWFPPAGGRRLFAFRWLPNMHAKHFPHAALNSSATSSYICIKRKACGKKPNPQSKCTSPQNTSFNLHCQPTPDSMQTRRGTTSMQHRSSRLLLHAPLLNFLTGVATKIIHNLCVAVVVRPALAPSPPACLGFLEVHLRKHLLSNSHISGGESFADA